MSDKKQGVIVCIDDEPVVLETLLIQLEDNLGSNFIYESALHAGEALELIRNLVHENDKIFVVISDWLMPDVKGDELLIMIHKQWPKIEKIMLTGQANEDSIENARQNADLKMCFGKPWEIEDIVNAIRQICDACPTP